jgi:hypothetical protein
MEVAANSQWNVRLWPKIEELMKQEPSLKDIHAFVAFSGSEVPSLPKPQFEGLATELVKLAGQVGPTLADAEELKISFMSRSSGSSLPGIRPGWGFLPSEDWPLSAKHIAAVTFMRFPHGWHRWQCPQADTGWTRQTTGKFRDIFIGKEEKVRRVLHETTRFVPGVPIWLVIVSDRNNDMTSHLFPTSREDREELFAMIEASNYDFMKSPFDQVWLYADFGQLKLRLFPRSDEVTR